MAAKKKSNRQERKKAKRKMMKNLMAPVRGGRRHK
jgi:hypothetical protein